MTVTGGGEEVEVGVREGSGDEVAPEEPDWPITATSDALTQQAALMKRANARL